MARDYKLISADSHINEPPDLWRDRVPAQYRDRVPRIEHFEQGDAWVMEGALDAINFGTNCCAGLPAEERSPWIKWEEVARVGTTPRRASRSRTKTASTPRSCIRPHGSGTRSSGTSAIPTSTSRASAPTTTGSRSTRRTHPTGLWGVALMPNIGTETAIEELHRALALPGMRGVLLGQYPHGGEQMSPEDDAFWAAVQEAGIPVSIHVAFATAAQGDSSRTRLTGATRFYDAPVRIQQFIDSGVFDRFPDLRLVFVEVDSSWTPYLREQLDDRYRRTAPARRAENKRLPSEYFADNILTTFITDPYAVPNRHYIGLSQMMWSSDYPHTGSDWPNSWTTINEYFAGVPDDEKHTLLAGNALRIYGEG